MKYLIFLVLIVYILNAEKEITRIYKTSNFENEIYDVSFHTSTYSYLTSNSIIIMNKNNQIGTKSLGSTVTANAYSALLQTNNGYFVACTNQYLIGFYGTSASSPETYSDSTITYSYKCSISYVQQYVVVT